MKIRSFFLFPVILILALGAFSLAQAQVGLGDDFRKVQGELNDALLDVYAGLPKTEGAGVGEIIGLKTYVKSGPAESLIQGTGAASSLSPAARIGRARALLQHIAALETIRCQQSAQLGEAQQWRALITLPQFASAVDGAMLLTQEKSRAVLPGVSSALAKEYLQWETMRIRQLLDFLQQQVAIGAASREVVEAYQAEITALSNFPPTLVQLAQVKIPPAVSASLAWDDAADTKKKVEIVAAWRDELEAGLPNLLTDSDIARMQRLLARFVKLVPREYANGVSDGKVLIPLEFREATQFTDQAQTLVNQLAPVWKQEHPEAYVAHRRELSEELGHLQFLLAHISSQDEITNQSKKISALLEDQFKITARRAGDSGDVIDLTALEVRTALGNSLAAAKADRWESAEAQRLDAYTAFDTEIEARVLPRDPDRARRVERSFLVGDGETPGIKALLDRRAPIDEIEAGYARTLKGMDECMELLKVAVSPATIGFTAFTIVAREGLEAIVILAALLAGLRGAENQSTRRGVINGAWLGLAVTILTFWASRTVIKSLSHFGEKLEAVVSVFAVIILLIVTNWVFHRVYWVEWNAKLRTLSKAAQNVKATRWETLALLGVGFLTVYREGFEMALFLQSLILEGGYGAVTVGGLGAIGFLCLVGILTFSYGMKLPYRKLLVVTGVLVVSIMATFLGSTVRLFQTVDWMSIHPITHLSFPNWVGLWLGLYPSWEGLLIPPLALVYVGGPGFISVSLHQRLKFPILLEG